MNTPRTSPVLFHNVILKYTIDNLNIAKKKFLKLSSFKALSRKNTRKREYTDLTTKIGTSAKRIDL